MKAFDVRTPDKPVLDFKAHEQQCTSLAICRSNERLLATVSTDGYINIWDIKDLDETNKPKLIQSRNAKVGGLFTCQFYEDSPWILAAGGMNGELFVWDTEESGLIVKHFQGQEAFDKLKQQEKEAGLEGRISPEPANDDESDDSEGYEDVDVDDNMAADE